MGEACKILQEGREIATGNVRLKMPAQERVDTVFPSGAPLNSVWEGNVVLEKEGHFK